MAKTVNVRGYGRNVSNKSRTKIKRHSSFPRIVSLNGDRKKINACKKAGLPLHNPRGDWNGYGYERLPLVVTLTTPNDVRKFNKICKEIENRPPTIQIDPETKINRWINRLSKLADISVEEAKNIANEKISYYEDNLEKRYMSAQQYEPRGVFARYPAWVRQAQKEYHRFSDDESKALDYIQDSDHAYAIIAASRRHRDTDYEAMLEEAKDLAKIGDIDKSEIREYALQNKKQYN